MRAVEERVLLYANAAGFNRYGFARKRAANTVKSYGSYHYFHNIPEPWGSYRYEDTYGSEKANDDPLVVHLQAGLPATAFSRDGIITHTRPDIVRRGAAILNRAGIHGLKSGIFSPLSRARSSWSFMILTTDGTDDVKDVLQTLPNFHLFAHHVYAMAELLLAECPTKCQLTRRQTEILKWAAVGKTSWEIGRILQISEATVNFHLATAASNLSVRGRRAACAKALALGFISL
jgi:DNA-binding CsgD family transcriptional regulator